MRYLVTLICLCGWVNLFQDGTATNPHLIPNDHIRFTLHWNETCKDKVVSCRGYLELSEMKECMKEHDVACGRPPVLIHISEFTTSPLGSTDDLGMPFVEVERDVVMDWPYTSNKWTLSIHHIDFGVNIDPEEAAETHDIIPTILKDAEGKVFRLLDHSSSHRQLVAANKRKITIMPTTHGTVAIFASKRFPTNTEIKFKSVLGMSPKPE